MATTDLDLGRYKLGWSDKVDYIYEPKKGLNEDVVRQISEIKGEPEWMMKFRLRALKIFERKPMAPWFAVNMPQLDFQDIYYYLKPSGEQVDEWDALPESMKRWPANLIMRMKAATATKDPKAIALSQFSRQARPLPIS